MQCIMVATDGSPGANRAVDAAARLATAMGSNLAILTVGGDLSGAELRRLADIGGDVSKSFETKSNRSGRPAECRRRCDLNQSLWHRLSGA